VTLALAGGKIDLK